MNFLFNQQIFNAVHSLAGKSRLFDILAIFLADYLGYLLILAALYLIFVHKKNTSRYQIFLFIALSLIISRGLLTEIIRYFIFQPRPFISLSFNPLVSSSVNSSFPSGHAAFYFTLAFSLFNIDRRWSLMLAVGALLMGIARIFAGVHWPFDVIGGLLVGFFSILIVHFLLSKSLKKQTA